MARLFLIAAMVLAATAATAEVCVLNGTEEPLVFTVETDAGERARADLAPGGQLCVGPNGPTAGTVGVFETLDAIEGCSLLVPDGHETLIAYASFDNCRWSKHDE